MEDNSSNLIAEEQKRILASSNMEQLAKVLGLQASSYKDVKAIVSVINSLKPKDLLVIMLPLLHSINKMNVTNENTVIHAAIVKKITTPFGWRRIFGNLPFINKLSRSQQMIINEINKMESLKLQGETDSTPDSHSYIMSLLLKHPTSKNMCNQTKNTLRPHDSKPLDVPDGIFDYDHESGSAPLVNYESDSDEKQVSSDSTPSL